MNLLCYFRSIYLLLFPSDDVCDKYGERKENEKNANDRNEANSDTRLSVVIHGAQADEGGAAIEVILSPVSQIAHSDSA